MTEKNTWEDAEPGVRRRILEAQGAVAGTLIDVFTPVREDLLKNR